MRSTSVANPIMGGLLNTYFADDSGYVASMLSPYIRTGQQSATYYVFDKDNVLSFPTDLLRAPSTAYKRTNLKLSDDSYRCVNKGIAVPVDDDERAKYASAFTIDDAAMRRANMTVKVEQEAAVHTLAISAAVAGGAPSPLWSAGSSYPIIDIKAGINAIYLATGMRPNLAIIPQAVVDVLVEHSTITDKIKYSTGGVVTAQLLSTLFGIPRILIPGVAVNSAADGQTIVPAAIWGKDVILAVTNDVQDLQAPNFMRSFLYTALTGNADIAVNTFREESIHSDVHEAFHYVDNKLVGPLLGYKITGAIA